MQQLNFPMTQHGLEVTATIGVPAPIAIAALAAGQTPLPGISVRALIDSGADATSVDPAYFARLGLSPVSPPISMTTAGGVVAASWYEMSLIVFGSQGLQGPLFVWDSWFATNFPHPLQGIDVLLGMDFIRAVKLNCNGPGGEFSLQF